MNKMMRVLMSVCLMPGLVQLASAVTNYSGQATQPISAAALPLPTGAATEATLSTLNSKIPASPAQDRTSSAAPSAARLSDGSAFYKATTPSDTQPVSAASLPLPSGAATSAKQPALGTAGSPSSDVISIQGIPSMTPINVDGSAVTQPVSAASLPLPSGASTAAKQPALGTAGTPSADVITIQGANSMTPLQVRPAVVDVPSYSSATATTSSIRIVAGNPNRKAIECSSTCSGNKLVYISIGYGAATTLNEEVQPCSSWTIPNVVISTGPVNVLAESGSTQVIRCTEF